MALPTTCGAAPSAVRPIGPAGVGGTLVLVDHESTTLAAVADVDGRALHLIDVEAGRRLASRELDARPSELVVLPDGRIVVALADRAALEVLVVEGGDAPALRPLCRKPTAVEPRGLAASVDGRRLFVVAGAAAALEIREGVGLEREDERPLGREPRKVLPSADGTRAFVSHAVGNDLSVVTLDTGLVRRIPLEERHDHELDELRKALRGIEQPDARRDALLAFETKLIEERDPNQWHRRRPAQGYALAHAAGRLFLPQVLVDTGTANHRSDGYGSGPSTVAASVAVVDEALGVAFQGSLAVDRGYFGRQEDRRPPCLLPRGAAVDDRRGLLLVTCLGADRLVSYDLWAAAPSLAPGPSWEVGEGPTGVVVDAAEQRAVVWSAFDRVLTLVDLRPGEEERPPRRVSVLTGPALDATVARGRSLFHRTGDPRIAADGRACASCHPEGGDDGLVWSTPDGPRRTPALAGRLEGTAPYGWQGSDASLDDHYRRALELLDGQTLRVAERTALTAYLGSLPLPPRRPVTDRAAVQRGREIFASSRAGCGECHRGERLSDGALHDVGSGNHADRGAAFDTPSLVGLAGRGGYFHDGRYGTLEELLEDPKRRMGHTSELPPAERQALVAFLESL
ncbi:MAG: hypothetical protein KC731_18700 [Myxococcales bacterium]|nr:hypothetical protein [Myxococcales bacterium]